MSEQNVNKNEEQVVEKRPVTRRYNKQGKRRGKYAFAAPVGFLVSILSIVGVIAVIMSVAGYIREKRDTTALKQELYYYLEPLLVYSPEPFSDATKKQQDAFLSAACYKVMLEEQNRILHEEDETSKYDIEQSLNCYFVPEEVVEDAYHELFGSKIQLKHRSVEDSGIEYNKTEKYYLIPIREELDTGYEMVIDEVKVRKDRYEVRVGFVPKTDIKYDEHGKAIAPTAKQATHFQTYTLTRNKDKGTYYIKSCKDEKK
ncbi:MAG: hypothetical protein IKA50_01170 [Clostridia bacterium]|nr:hypothetical protein [Clostridia bacterium]